MHCICLIISALLLPLAGITQQALNSAGTSRANAALQLEWSLGEVRIQSSKTDYLWLTDGLLQPSAGTATQPPPLPPLVQVIAGYGLDNAGTSFVNTANGNNILLEFTLGETASRTLSAPGNLLTQGLLQPFVPINHSPLPVSGWHLEARRLDANRVELNWRTLQEFHNRGFGIERKKENESSFQPLAFENSLAPGGSSSQPLDYRNLDANAFAGKSWYRLRQEDADGRIAYSNIAQVSGASSVTIEAWPNPPPMTSR